jgi:hypothetical protein
MTTRIRIYFTIIVVLALLALRLLWPHLGISKTYSGFIVVAIIVVIQVCVSFFMRGNKNRVP